MKTSVATDNKAIYDAIAIGSGICGIIFLKYAVEAGLKCLALEKQDSVGGLWSRRYLSGRKFRIAKRTLLSTVCP